MTVRQRPLILVDGHRRGIQITDDGSRTLADSYSGLSYHSASGAVSETQHVYLENSGVAGRLMESKRTEVLEIGFGTGLAMLLTLDSAISNDVALQYTSVDHELLEADLLRNLEMERHLGNPDLVDQFLAWRASLGFTAPKGVLVWKVSPDHRITIHHQSAERWISEVTGSERFDAIYFDPFSPSEDARLWRPSFLQRMHTVLRADKRLVTYCVSRTVREAMESVGFQVQRVAGPPGGKREVMIATKT